MFPSDCRFCQATLLSFSRLPVCHTCLESIQSLAFARCTRCGDLLTRPDAEFGDACCPECALEPPPYQRAVSFTSYTGALRRLIHLLKYERVRAAAVPLAEYVVRACEGLVDEIEAQELVLIPVPAHKSRLRARGFNQAELIARGALRGVERTLSRRLTLDTTTLLRTRFTGSQVARTAEERREQIRGAFKVKRREHLKGCTVLLLDDVLTTGATAAECSRELLHAGAAAVWVVTPARALSRAAMESFGFPEEFAPDFAPPPPDVAGRVAMQASWGRAQDGIRLRSGKVVNYVEQSADAPGNGYPRSGTYAHGES